LKFSGEELDAHLEAFWQESLGRDRLKLQMMIEKGIPGAKEKLDEFNEGCATLDRWKTELESVQDPIQRSKILMRHARESHQIIFDQNRK
jgi:hypothetical protein